MPRRLMEHEHREDLLYLQRTRPEEAERLRAQGRRLLKLDCPAMEVAAELHVPVGAVQQWASRLRRIGERSRNRETLFCLAGCGWPAREGGSYCQLHAHQESATPGKQG